METFLECETMCREMPPGHVFAESIQGKWQKWCMVHVTKKNNASATHFLALSETHSTISLECARLSIFGLKPTCQVSSKSVQVRELLLAKTTFQIVTIISEPIRDQIADNYAVVNNNISQLFNSLATL